MIVWVTWPGSPLCWQAGLLSQRSIVARVLFKQLAISAQSLQLAASVGASTPACLLELIFTLMLLFNRPL